MALQTIKGYTSVFGNEDSDGDVVVSGAFSTFLQDSKNQYLPLFFGHENVTGPWATPVGVTFLVKEDDYGLYFEGFLVDTPKAQEIVSLVKTGATIDSSYTYEEIDRDGQNLKELALYEISIVTAGANKKAYVELGDVITDEEELNVSEMLYKSAHARHLSSGIRSETTHCIFKTIDDAISRVNKVDHKQSEIDIAIERIKTVNILRNK